MSSSQFIVIQLQSWFVRWFSRARLVTTWITNMVKTKSRFSPRSEGSGTRTLSRIRDTTCWHRLCTSHSPSCARSGRREIHEACSPSVEFSGGAEVLLAVLRSRHPFPLPQHLLCVWEISHDISATMVDFLCKQMKQLRNISIVICSVFGRGEGEATTKIPH